MYSKKVIYSHSEADTLSAALEFSKELQIGDIVAFLGELGSGKTLFIKGICNFFKVEEIITSPTFTIMNQYTGYLNHSELTIIHLDLYRIKNLNELIEIGFIEATSTPNAIILIEWADKAKELIPKPHYLVLLETLADNENHRRITIDKIE